MGHKEKGDKAKFQSVDSRRRGACQQNLRLEPGSPRLEVLTEVPQPRLVSTRPEQRPTFAVGDFRTS